jgi:hypothetical protein
VVDVGGGRTVELMELSFDIEQYVRADPEVVWAALLDWQGRGRWVSFTRVVPGDPGDADGVGATFTAFTGWGWFKLEDRMRVEEIRLDRGRRCRVAKLGPIVVGEAAFEVKPFADASTVRWVESVSVRFVPNVFAGPARWVAGKRFRRSLHRLDRQLRCANGSVPVGSGQG